jgi:hypothetical protein
MRIPRETLVAVLILTALGGPGHLRRALAAHVSGFMHARLVQPSHQACQSAIRTT